MKPSYIHLFVALLFPPGALCKGTVISLYQIHSCSSGCPEKKITLLLINHSAPEGGAEKSCELGLYSDVLLMTTAAHSTTELKNITNTCVNNETSMHNISNANGYSVLVCVVLNELTAFSDDQLHGGSRFVNVLNLVFGCDLLSLSWCVGG